jgi:hypothetical protein
MWKATPQIIHPAIVKSVYNNLFETKKNPAYKSVNNSSIKKINQDEKPK